MKRTLSLVAVLLLIGGCSDGADTPDDAEQPVGGGGNGGSSQSSTAETSSSTSPTTSTGTGDGGSGGAGGEVPFDPPETVIVQGPLGLTPDVPIVVHDADGEVIEVTQTNAGGAVEVNVPPGGAVTALSDRNVVHDSGTDLYRMVFTDYDITQGSTVVFNLYEDQSYVTPDPMQFSIFIADYPLAAASASIWACGSRHDFTLYYPATIQIPNMDVYCYDEYFWLTLVLWDEGGQPIGVRFAGLYDFTPGGANSFTFSTYDAPQIATLAWTGIPADTLQRWAGAESATTSGKVFGFNLPLGTAVSGAASFPFAPGWDNSATLYLALPDGRYATRRWGPMPNPTTLTFDGIPLEGIEASPLDLSELSRPRFGWEGYGPGESGDEIMISWAFADPATNVTQAFTGRTRPTSSGSVRFPALPSELAGYAPQLGQEFYSYSVIRVDHDGTDSYEDALELPLDGGDRFELAAAYYP